MFRRGDSLQGVADVFLDEVGVDCDGGSGSFACGGDHLSAGVAGVAADPDAGHAGLAGGVDPGEAFLVDGAVAAASCTPTTLASDVKVLREEHTYELVRERPVDMFPHTPHVETVALLERDPSA